MKSLLKVYLTLLVGICCSAWWPIAPANAETLSDAICYLDACFAAEGQENNILNVPGVFLPNATPFQAVGFTEPNSSVLSDIVWVNVDLGLNAASDNNGIFPQDVPPLTQLTFLQLLPETGAFQDIGIYFGLQEGTLRAFSDTSEVPLPAALPLFAGGLGVIGLFARRRKRKDVAALAAA